MGLPSRWCLKYTFLLWTLHFFFLLRSRWYFQLVPHPLVPLPITEMLPFGWKMCPVLSQGIKQNHMNWSTHRCIFKSVGLRNSLAPHLLLKTQITTMVVPPPTLTCIVSWKKERKNILKKKSKWNHTVCELWVWIFSAPYKAFEIQIGCFLYRMIDIPWFSPSPSTKSTQIFFKRIFLHSQSTYPHPPTHTTPISWVVTWPKLVLNCLSEWGAGAGLETGVIPITVHSVKYSCSDSVEKEGKNNKTLTRNLEEEFGRGISEEEILGLNLEGWIIFF